MSEFWCSKAPQSSGVRVRSLLVVLLMAAVLSGFSLANVACRGYAQDSTVYTVSGYILDANGNGIKGAQIIFNVPDVVKSVYSDSTGHYAIYAPVGTYHLNVWPPWDSSYIDYDQSGLVVSSDMTKNITLNQGCKLSGYITDMSGNPVQGAVVSLNGYLAGWFSNYQGYYFVCAPAGTYKLTVNPRSGYHHFVNYYESNLSLKQNVTKNITVVLTNNSNPSPSPGHGPFKISGYILDANGKGIKGAMVIFGVPDIVPSVYSDSAGYYAIYAPSGSYYLNVWPPFDSNFIYYDQPILTVSADMTKNITLSSGYKVSGYITSTTGQPVKDGLVLLDNYLSGWFSKDTGYYFVCAPAGTYKLWASPRNGYNHFAIYSESNFVLDRNIVKNIIVVLTGTPTPSPTPEPTPSPTPDQGWISISVDAQSPVVGSMVSVMGRLTDYDEHPIPNKPITLSYADTTNAELSWTNIGSATTTATGEYSIQWRIAAAGNFLFKVEWIISGNFAAAINTTSVGFLPADSKLTMPAEPGNTIVSQQAYTVETEQEVNTDVSCWLWVGVVTLAIAVVIVTALAVRTVKNKTTSRTVQKQALK